MRRRPHQAPLVSGRLPGLPRAVLGQHFVVIGHVIAGTPVRKIVALAGKRVRHLNCKAGHRTRGLVPRLRLVRTAPTSSPYLINLFPQRIDTLKVVTLPNNIGVWSFQRCEYRNIWRSIRLLPLLVSGVHPLVLTIKVLASWQGLPDMHRVIPVREHPFSRIFSMRRRGNH